MKRSRAVPFGIALLGVVLGCASTPVDPETNVSIPSYRAALVKTQSNLWKARATVAAILSLDATHSPEWKSAQIGVLDDTATLISDTLAGSKVGQK